MRCRFLLTARPAASSRRCVVGSNSHRAFTSSEPPGKSIHTSRPSKRCSATLGGGGARYGETPSTSALQRQTKAWLKGELSDRGVVDLSGTKAVLADRLHHVWGETLAAGGSSLHDGLRTDGTSSTPQDKTPPVNVDAKPTQSPKNESVVSKQVVSKGRDDSRGSPPPKKSKGRGKAAEMVEKLVEEQDEGSSSGSVGEGGRAGGSELHLNKEKSEAGPSEASKPKASLEESSAAPSAEAELLAGFQKLKVADLQLELVALGLPKSGKKAVLIERLVQAKLGRREEQPLAREKPASVLPPKQISGAIQTPAKAEPGCGQSEALPSHSPPGSKGKTKPAKRRTASAPSVGTTNSAPKATAQLSKGEAGAAKRQPSSSQSINAAEGTSGSGEIASRKPKPEKNPSSTGSGIRDPQSDNTDVESALRAKIAMLQAEIAKREKTLKMLQDKLQSAEQAESVDQAMLARMRATISDMEKQRQTWQDFLQSSRANIVKTTADDIRVNIRPQLEEQLSDLEAMAQDLEGEMQVKDDVVQRLTDSLNRSLGSTATEDQDVGKFSSTPAAESSPAPQDAPPEQEAPNREEGRGRVGGIGVALAAGVIAVLDGLSLFQSVNKKGKGSDEESGHKTDGDEVK